MKKTGGIIASIVILLLLCSGAFANILKFFAWLFTLQYSQPDTSIAGGIIARILTFVVSYSLICVIFDALRWFNSGIMKIAYFIISTLLGFVIAYIVWGIEQYILIICIVLSIIVLFAAAYFITKSILSKKNQTKVEDGGKIK